VKTSASSVEPLLMSRPRSSHKLAIHHFKGLSRILWVAAPGRNGVRAFVTHAL